MWGEDGVKARAYVMRAKAGGRRVQIDSDKLSARSRKADDRHFDNPDSKKGVPQVRNEPVDGRQGLKEMEISFLLL